MAGNNILNIPGYLEAVSKEQLVRDAAFLGVRESIGPFEVLPLTLWHFTILRIANHPLLYRKTPALGELLAFIWLVCPGYPNPEAKAELEKRFVRHCLPPKNLTLWNTMRARVRRQLVVLAAQERRKDLIASAQEYLDEAFMDKPLGAAKGGFEMDYYSDAAFFCARFGREFGWSQEETLRMPMKRVFQYMNEIKAWNGLPQHNPLSDGVLNRWTTEKNKRRN